MMEGRRCEEIETSNEIGSEIKTEPITEVNSIFYEKDGKLVELDSELREDVCAVLKRVKYEETEVAEEIEPGTLSQTGEIPRSEKSLEFSGIMSECTDHTPLTSLCRLCATRSNSMIYMFNQNELQDNVIEKIEYCLPIKVKRSDTLPKEICHLCLEKLEMCYQFHKTVEAAEKHFLTLDDGQCNEEKYTSFSDRDARSSIIEPQSILQELLKANTGTSENSTILSNSMLRNETYCTNRPNEERGTESSSDKDSQSICNSLLTSPLHDMDEKPRFEINPSLEEEAKTYESDNSNVVRKEVFNKRTSAEQRIIGHELIKCQNCRETFETVNQCFAHSSIRASKDYFPCCLCGAIFQTEEDCNQHRLEHEQGENTKTEGLQTSSDNESLKKPLREAKLKAKMELNSNISSKNELHCKKCNEDIDSETSLHQRYQHMLDVHKQQKKLSHNICEKELSASEQLIALQSKRDFSFECKLCDRRFRSNYDLEVHEKTDCSKPLVSTKKEFTCMYCRQRFRLKGDLKIHLRIHTGERSYDCDICGKMFRIKDIKESNLTINTSQRPFKCSKCNKRFSTSAILTLHSLVHSDARPYSCHLCHLSFKTLRGKDLHLTIHTGERPFKCSKCEKRFPTSSALTRHSLVHSDAKPYSCHLCNLSFKRKYGRDLHLRKHTGEKPYKCDICGVSHTKMSLFLRHRRLKPCLKALAARSQN